MDVCGPAQEQETSGSGTRAEDELIRQTSKGEAKRWDAKTEVRRFWPEKTHSDRLVTLPLRRWEREGKGRGSFLC